MSLKLDVWGLTTEFVEVELRISIFKCVFYVERLNLHHENASILECTEHAWYRYYAEQIYISWTRHTWAMS